MAPLFITNAEFTSMVAIKNLAPGPVVITATFQSLEGEAVAVKRLEIAANSSTTVNIDRVEMVEHRFADLGSVALSTTDEVSNIAASVEIISRDAHNSVSILEEFESISIAPSHTRTAYVSAGMSIPLLALHSEAKVLQTISIDCSDGYGRTYQSQLVLHPGMTFLVNGCITSRSESRTYKDILRGDGVLENGKLAIWVTADGTLDRIAVWGLSSAKTATAVRFESIEFTSATPPAARPPAKP